jgi:aryl-alcohol dehydrogenase-like predicted oxidoreductase
LKKQGKVSLIGVSADGPALESAVNSNLLDVVMLTYNLIGKKAIKQINLAYEKGCGILVKSPLAHTLYSNEIFKIRRLSDIWYLMRSIKNYPSQFLSGRKYRFIKDFEGWSAHEIALLYALHEKVSCVVTGTTDMDHMQRNLITFEKELPLEIKARIDKVE